MFDVLKGTGTNGMFTYPDDATDPYRAGARRNEWTVDQDSVLLGDRAATSTPAACTTTCT